MQQVNKRDRKRHLNRDYRERVEITKAPWHLKGETSENGFMRVEREKWPNARVGPADGGGLVGQLSWHNDYHVIVLYPNYRMSQYGQIVIGVEIVEKKGLKVEKTEMPGLRCWGVPGACSWREDDRAEQQRDRRDRYRCLGLGDAKVG